MTFGERLTEKQFNATSSSVGIFEYTPPLGKSMQVGEHIITAKFLPENAEEDTVTTTRKVVVGKAKPKMNWDNPDVIFEGTQLTRKQQNAGCINLPGGEYFYKPKPKTKLAVGDHELSVEYVPEEEHRKNYTNVTISRPITVKPTIMPDLIWHEPADIFYGTPLTYDNVLTAICLGGVEGRLEYDPPAGTILEASPVHTLKATFTPHDRVQFRTAARTVSLHVKKALAKIYWLQPESIYLGTSLSAKQLNGSCTEIRDGVFMYSPPIDSVLPLGNHDITLQYFPSGEYFKNYAPQVIVKNISVLVLKIPQIIWATPQPIYYGTPLLLENVLNAKCIGCD